MFLMNNHISFCFSILLVLLSFPADSQIFVDSTGSNGFGDVPHPLAKNRFSNTDHEYNLFLRTTGQDSTNGVGIYNFIDSGKSDKYGLWNHVEQSVGSTGFTYGVRNIVSHGGDLDAFAIYNDLSNTRDSKGRLFGIYNIIDDAGALGRNKMYANIYSETVHRRRKNAYGSYLLVRSLARGPKMKSYGQYIDLKGKGSAIRYGLYSNINGGAGYAGYFVGNVHINGVLTQASDERLKKNISEISNALGIIKKLNPHTYNYRADKNMGFGDEGALHYGFVAQEVAEVLPDLVSQVAHSYTETHQVIESEETTNELGIPAITDKMISKNAEPVDVLDKDVGIQGVRYMDMIAILTKAMQEQQSMIEDQREQIEELIEETRILRERLFDNDERIEDIIDCTPCEGRELIIPKILATGGNYRVYPNPTADHVTIEKISGFAMPVYIRLITSTGQLVADYRMPAASLNIQLNGVPAGSYLIEVLDISKTNIIEKHKLIITK
jgi:hypothetical protein